MLYLLTPHSSFLRVWRADTGIRSPVGWIPLLILKDLGIASNTGMNELRSYLGLEGGLVELLICLLRKT
jgi:hypothetical protein